MTHYARLYESDSHGYCNYFELLFITKEKSTEKIHQKTEMQCSS